MSISIQSRYDDQLRLFQEQAARFERDSKKDAKYSYCFAVFLSLFFCSLLFILPVVCVCFTIIWGSGDSCFAIPGDGKELET